MAVHKGRGAQGLVQNAQGVVDEARENIWIDRLTRIGYFARGIIYGLVGILAFQLVFNGRGKITDQTGALATLAAQPFGKFLLIIVAIGLVGLLIWGFIRAVADPFHKGSDMKGLVTRAGYMISGISYGALLVPTLNLIQGAGQKSGGSTQQAQNAAAGILTHSWGQWLVGLIGLALIGIGIFRILSGVNARLNERLNSYKMTAEQHRWAIRLGRLGYIAIGVVFIIMGILAVLAATTLDPKKIGGIDQALAFLSRQPYGPYLLALVALGLIAFAVYSFMGSLWFRIKEL